MTGKSEEIKAFLKKVIIDVKRKVYEYEEGIELLNKQQVPDEI